MRRQSNLTGWRYWYVRLWTPIGYAVTLASIFLAIALVNRSYERPPQYALMIASLVAATGAVVGLELFGRFVVGPEGAAIDLRTRGTWLLFGGYALAILLAVILFRAEIADRRAGERSAQQREAFQNELRQLQKDPDVQRGMDILEQRKQRQRATTEPGGEG